MWDFRYKTTKEAIAQNQRPEKSRTESSKVDDRTLVAGDSEKKMNDTSEIFKEQFAVEKLSDTTTPVDLLEISQAKINVNYWDEADQIDPPPMDNPKK